MRLPLFHVRTLMLAVALIALLLGGWNMVVLRNKASHCRWVAEFHRAIARQCQEEAAKPGLSPSDAVVIRRNGRMQELIARKYSAVAENPMLPYPKGPLVTPEEQAELNAQ